MSVDLFDKRQRLTIAAKAQATADPRQFLHLLGVKHRRGNDYRCPKCGDFRLCAYKHDGGGYTFTCHKCRPGEKLDAIEVYLWLQGGTFNEARDWLMSMTCLSDGEALKPSPLKAPSPASPAPGPDGFKATPEAFRAGANALLSVSLPLTLGSAAGSYLAERQLFDVCLDAGVRHLGSSVDETKQLARTARDQIGEVAALASGLWSVSAKCPGGHAFLPYLSHTLVIPWRDQQGQVCAIRRRVVGALSGDVAKYMTTKGAPVPPLPFMHPSDAAACMSSRFGHVVITEGEFDALMLRAHGEQAGVIPSGSLVVASGGASMVGRFLSVRGWREMLEGREVVLAFDADKAGQEAARRLAGALSTAGVHGRITAPRGGKDWAETLGRAA